jgi:class 3 adenylate cyclase/tetratricopeptide (TPR) repeat protein
MDSKHCAGCGHRASAHARFCERCGAALTPRVRPLRAPSALEARILEERTAIEGERKQVTVMYADIVDSMELTRSLEAERWGFVLDRFLTIAASAVHAFEGTVNQFTGDGLLAVFGAPLAHEDHARRACLAVLELQREVAGLAAEIAARDGVTFAVRCGLNSGEVIVGSIGDDVHMDFVPLGNTTALGKRIESLAPAGSAAISSSTAALVEGEFEVRDLGEFELKGADGVHRVLELIGPGAATTRLQAMAATRGLSRFVGRDAERAELESALEHALAGDGRAVGIVGDPGVGKSRLVHEFVADCEACGVPVHSTAALAHGRYLPLVPILALYRDIFGIDADDATEIARERAESAMPALDPEFAEDLPLLFEFLGVSDRGRPLASENASVHRLRLLVLLTRIVKARGHHQATVLVVEDLHWMDDASATVVKALVAAVPGTRTILVATYRPEHEAPWASTVPHKEIALGPLDADAIRDLLTHLLGRDPSLQGLEAMIGARTAGNPFFAEEVVQALAENGHLAGARGAYRLESELERLVLPPTVQAGLAARMDRLPAREKALVQTMSVIGGAVPEPLLSAVSELGSLELTEAMEVLARSQWVVPGDVSGDREHAFKHPLTQEVAYRSQLSEHRARAHRMVAAAIERTYPGALDERAALLAHHCEASGDLHTGADWHARAAVWAERTSPADSLRHWRRVRHLAGELELSPESEALATKARIGILGLTWRLGMSPDEFASIRAETRLDAKDVRLELYSAGSLMHGAREREGLEGFREVSRHVAAAGGSGGGLTASTGVAYASWIAGSLRKGVESLNDALALAGDDPKTDAGLAFICPLAHAYHSRGQCSGYMGELEQARRDCERAIELAREHDDAQTLSAAHANLALLEADVGDHEAALDIAMFGLEVSERSGDVVHMVACSVPAAVAEARAGRFADALARAESNLATIREHGIGRYFEPVLLATIARCKLALGEPRRALATAEEAVQIAATRGLGTCALQAPLALAHVLIATQGAAAGERIEAVLGRALRVARECGASAFETLIDHELEALARLREEPAHQITVIPRSSETRTRPDTQLP